VGILADEIKRITRCQPACNPCRQLAPPLTCGFSLSDSADSLSAPPEGALTG